MIVVDYNSLSKIKIHDSTLIEINKMREKGKLFLQRMMELENHQ